MNNTPSTHPDRHTLVAFDFDGTLTKTDTFIAFIRFTHGLSRLIWGILRYAPWLLLMKLRLYPNGRMKERMFAHFYRGSSYEQFVRWGHEFAKKSDDVLNSQMAERLHWHISEGHMVCVVTASIEEWVAPLCRRMGIDMVVATRVEVSPGGLLTGRFSTPNCYGRQKVVRLFELFPLRQSYHLYAYGDSRGDRDLLIFADEGYFVKRGHYNRIARAKMMEQG